MRKMHSSHFCVSLGKFLLFASIFIIFILCSSFNGGKRNFESGNNSTVCFDYFSYNGVDDFCIKNHLPDKVYFYNTILPGWYSRPGICTNAEGYFLVTSTFSYFPGVPIFYSKDLFQTKEGGDWWTVFLACRPIKGQFENLGREPYMMPVKWSLDGFPYMTQGDDLIPMVLQQNGTTSNSNIRKFFNRSLIGKIY